MKGLFESKVSGDGEKVNVSGLELGVFFEDPGIEIGELLFGLIELLFGLGVLNISPNEIEDGMHLKEVREMLNSIEYEKNEVGEVFDRIFRMSS